MKVTIRYANNATRVVEVDDLAILRLAQDKADADDEAERQKTKSKPVAIVAVSTS